MGLRLVGYWRGRLCFLVFDLVCVFQYFMHTNDDWWSFSMIDSVSLQQVVIEGQFLEKANMSQLLLLPSVEGQY
jgi:hypothetical protein